MSMLDQRLLQDLEKVVGEAGLVRDEQRLQSYLSDWRNAYRGKAALVVRPASTEQVAAVVRLCSAAGVALVPQGGNTGLCGGSIPDGSGTQVVLSLTRMTQIRDVDAGNETITVEAGVLLQRLQEAAAEAGRLFPLSLGAEGSCTVGGNLATNAGGTAVLRYGNMRDLVLGLEVVLPDGRIWNGLRGLRKDNTGYDLKHLFVGSEGTLGIITAAVLKLYPAVRSRTTAWVAFEQGEALDAVVASNEAQVAALWKLREGISEAQNHEGPSLKHDISVPVSRIPAFIAQADARLQQAFPGVRIVAYGHVGDGNLHYNISKPLGSEDAPFKAQAEAIMQLIYDVTAAFAGSISAEHGLGQAKREAARRYKDPLELELMRTLKNALDPAGLMNPGKLL
jgi:FAD/FMN-containing dehydrogenase